MPVKVINKSVRDHSQIVTIRGHLVTVQSKVGRRTGGSYAFPLSAWLDISRQIGNPMYDKRAYVAAHTAQMDNESGGPDQADRIRDAQVYAIDKAVGLLGTDTAE